MRRVVKRHEDPRVPASRTLRPLDTDTIVTSVARTHQAVVVDEGWRSGSLSAEISARITETVFYELDAPVARVCSAEMPIPYASTSSRPRSRKRL